MRHCMRTPVKEKPVMRLRHPISILMLALLASACTPRVELAVPNEPININLNVKIEHEIYIKVDKQLDSIINEDSGLF
ncbi:lipoprotein [Stutzerimonas stutzeri]|nr:lipoprotein [Stutzerimonas stutzeri]